MVASLRSTSCNSVVLLIGLLFSASLVADLPLDIGGVYQMNEPCQMRVRFGLAHGTRGRG